MRNSKRWLASLLAVLLIIQSFSAVDLSFFQLQAAYANTDTSSEQSLTSAQDTGEMQGGETSSDTQTNSETTQNNGTESVTASTGELTQTSEANLFVDTTSTNFLENTTQTAISVPSDGTDTTNDVLTDNSTLVTNSAAISVPANVSVNVYGNKTIGVIWESVDGADGYEVSLNDNVYSTSSFTHTFYSLDSNTPYTIKVRAVNNDVCSDWSPDIVKYTLLDTPKNLFLTTSSSISVSLAWDAVSGATRYEIYRNSSLIGTSFSNSYTDNTVSADLTYKYKVKAYNDTGNVSDFSSPFSIITSTTVPSLPAYFNATASHNTIMVTWSTIVAATRYEVSFDGNIISTTAPYYLFQNLEPNTQHVIKVRTVNHVGSSEWSEEIIKITSLGTPANIRAVPSNTSVSLVWDTVLGATYYEIYRDDSLISTSNTNKYSELGLTENVTYTYKIKASNENNASVLSESYTATTLMVPATPANVNAETTSGAITIRWDSIADAESYDISVNDNITNVNSNNHTFDGLQSNSLYKFKVRAYNAGEYGDWSEEKSSYTLLTTPVNLSTTTASAISVNLIWDAVAGATKYDVYRDNSKITSVYTNKYTDTGLTANTSYTYSVKAYNDYNESAESNIITATTQELKITSFSFNSLNPKAIGTIDQQTKIITVLVSPYVNVKELEATFTASTTAVKVGTTEQISGVTINDYTNPVTFTLLSNGLEVNYTVKVTKVESYGAGFIQVCAGDEHTVALKGDGTVWAWGYNGIGQLGDGTRDKSAVPVKVANISGVKAIASGLDHTIALKGDGTVWAWGYNYYGQLGDGTTIYSTIPVKVAGISGVEAIYAGGNRNIVLKEDGTVWAWGDNRDGRLGDGTNEDSKTPIKINGLTGVTEISIGLYHTVALKEDGTVWAWGLNSYGQFGDGIYNGYSMVPKQITGISGVKAVAAGGVHTLLLKEDGTVWASGDNPYGQLGNGTKSYSCTPIQVVGIDGGVKEIAAGEIFSVALKEDGTVWTWGADDYGQLCNGSGGSSISPLKVPGANAVKAITAGFSHTLAIQDNGMLLAWGSNDYGQLGDGTTCDDYIEMQMNDIPVQVLNNIAFNKPLTISSANDATNNGHNVVDSNKTTNWSFSNNNETEWFSIDLENKYSINKVKLIWDENYYISYNIKVSEDGSNWADICSGTLDYFDVNDINFSPVIGRYIRIDFSDKFINSEYSLSEIEVYGKAIPPVFTPAVGFSDSAQTVTLSCTTEGAEIRYTTNGTMPNSRSNLYSGPITIEETTTIKACAIKAGIIQSDTVSASYFIGTDTIQPTAPSNLSASSITTKKAALSWTASTDNIGIALYEIYCNGSKVGESNKTSFTCTDLVPGTSYTFSVKAVDLADNISEASNELIVNTVVDDYSDDFVSAISLQAGVKLSGVINALGDEDIFRFIPSADGLYNIKIVSNFDSYGYLYDGSGLLIMSNNDTENKDFLLSGNLLAKQTYFVKVTCNNNSDTGEYDLIVNYIESQAPTAPENFVLTSQNDGTVYFTWSHSTDNVRVSGYELYRDGNIVNKLSADICQCSDTGLSPLSTYSYTIKAFDAAGNKSVNSQAVSVTTGEDIQAPTAPTEIVAPLINARSLILSWTASSDNFNVVRYEIYNGTSKIATSAETNCTLTGLAPKTEYSFTIKSVDAAGNASTTSSAITITTVDDDYGDDNTSAEQITIGTKISAVINCSGDVDFFKFTPAVNGVYNIFTDNWSSKGYLYNDNGTLIYTGPYCAGISAILEVNNTYYLKVEGEIGNYNLNVLYVDDDYGNDMNSAGLINIGSSLSAVKNYEQDVDFFKFTPAIDGTYIINVNGQYPTISLYDNDGVLLSSSGSPTATMLTKDITYYIKVENYYTGNYSIEVSYVDTQAPSAPTDFTVFQINDGTVTLVWSYSTDNVGVAGYKLYRDGLLIKTITGQINECVDTGLSLDTSYYYTLKAYDVEGNKSLDSEILCVTTVNYDTQPPTAPVDIATSNVTARSVRLTWTASTDNFNVERYDIYHESSKIATSTETNCTLTGLTPATSYTFMVKAVDSSENISTTSSAITVTTLEDDYGDDISSAVAINAETDVSGVINFNGDWDFFKFIPITDGNYNIENISNINTYGYLYNSGGAIIANASKSGNNSSFLISSNLKAGETYYVAVKHYYNYGTGTYTLKISYIDTLAPSTPENLAILSKDDGTVHLTWSPATDNIGVTGYELYRDGNLIKTLNGDVLQYSDTGLTPLTTYSYAVKAFDAAGNRSLHSQALSVTTDNDDEAPTAPTNLVASSITARSLTLTWTASTDNYNVARYEIYNDSSKIATSAETNYTVTGLTPATSHTFMVKAVDSSENISTTSGAITVTTLEDDYGDDICSAFPIDLETDVSAAINFNGDVDFFKFTPKVDGYYNFLKGIKIENNSLFECLYNSDGNYIIGSNFLNDWHLDAGKTYYFKVENLDNETVSYIVNIHLLDKQAPSTPENLNVSTIAEGTAYITWSPSNDNIGVAGYKIYRNGILINTVTGLVCEYSDTGLSPGNTYFYTIKSFDEDGNISEESNPLSVTVINRDDFDYSIPLQEGVDLPGEFNYNGDVDFYSFIPNTDGTYKIQSTGNMDTYGYLYDSNKITLDYNDDSGVDNNFSITKKLKANQTYYIKVMNYYNTGTGSYCINVTAIDDQNPTTPTNLAIESKTYTTVSLIWNVSTDNVGVVGYDVYRDNLKVGTATSTEYVDTGLMPGTTYTYMIKARDAIGNTSSASDFISAETDPDYEVPTVPTNLEITAKTCLTISLSWNKSTDNSAIAGYEVYRNSSMVATTTTNLLNYTDSELMPNTTYEYTVKAKDIAGNISADSNSVSETTSLDTEPPIAPGKITVISKSDTTITISWLVSTDNASVSGYEIYRDGFKITTSSGISFTDTGLNANTTYTYSIKACDSYGNISDASESMDVTTYLLATPNVVATGYSSSILLSWNAVEGATDYEIKFDTGIINIGNVTSYIHSDLNPSTRYYYEIRAKAGNETSNWSTVNCYTAPDIPTNIKVTPSSNYVSISWDRAYGSYSYDIEDNGNIVGSTTQTNFLHYNLSPSTQHTYKVRAKNSSTSEWSIPVTTMTLLNIPSNITCITSSSAITINWSAAEKATGYEIEVDGQIVYSDSNTTFVHENLLPNTRYRYMLRAKNDLVTSDWSYIDVTTKFEKTKNITAIAEDTSITFTWDPVSGASKYIVELNSPNCYKVPRLAVDWLAGTYTNTENFSAYSNTLTIDKLYPCTNYTYRVYADDGEISEYGTIKTSFWTAKNITSYTTDLTAAISWDSVGDMMKYDVCVDDKVIDLGTTREYAESNLIPGTEHIYKVRARNDNEGYISDWEEIKCSTILNYSPGTWSDGVGMPDVRSSHATVSLNGKLYVLGGIDKGNSVIEYNPDTGKWTNKSDMNLSRTNCIAVSVNNKIYAVGGKYLSSIEEYDPSLDRWKLLTNVPGSGEIVAATAINGKIYAICEYGELFEYDLVTDTWVKKACMPTARKSCGAAVVNNKIYVMGGCSSSTDVEARADKPWGWGYYDTVEEYDPAMDKWSKKANMPTASSSLGVVALNGKIYAIGGWGGNKTQEYDPSTNTWSVKSALAPFWKAMSEAAELNGKIYVTGGFDDNYAFAWMLGYMYTGSVYVFEPDKTTWSTNTYIPKNRSEYASAALNGKIYVMGGRNNGSAVKTVDEYDIKTKTWTRKADMPTARYSFSAIALNGKIYVVGGADDSGLLNVFEEYDPENDIWVRKKDFTLKASSPGVTTACGKIYVVVGEYGSIPWDYSPILEYNPDTDIWKTLGEMKTNRSDFAIASANDKIYTFGGYSYWGREDVAEEFDPKTNTWTSLPFSFYRRNAKAVGINGKIYLMGGDDFGNVSSTVEEFDPATNTLRNIEYMTLPRNPENAVVMNNKIYIVSGDYGNNSLPNSIESYTVAGLQFSPGSPISNFTEQVEDIRIESNVLPMSFSRTYNSGLNYEKTIVGNGWRTNYDSSVSEVQESGKVIAGALNVREEPWGEIITQISKNTIVNYLYKNAALQSDGRYWHYVQLPDGTKGYVAAWYIQDITGLEVTYSSGSRTVFENENGLYKAPYGTYDKLDAIDQGYKLTTKEQTKYYYNIDGKLIAVEDKNGNKHTIYYNSENKPSKVIDFAGKSITFTYTDGKLADITDSNGRNVSYSYDTYGNLTSVTDPTGNQTTYNYYLEYKDDGSLKSSRLKQIIDTYGNQIKKNEYDLFGRLKKQYDGINNAKSYSYSDIKLDENSLYDSVVFNQYSINENGNSSKTALNLAIQKPITETDLEGRTAYYKYYVDLNCDGKWTDITYLKQGTSLYSAYNIAIQQGNKPTKEEITDRNGNVTIYETDARGNTIKITNPDNSYKEFEYDINNNLIKCKDEERNSTYYIYDEATNTLLYKKVQPLNGTDDYSDTSDQTKFSITNYNYYSDTECNQLGYKAKGLVKTVTDPCGNTEIYTYTNDGNVRTVSNLDTGIISTFEYYLEGWKKAEISPKGIRTEYIYDRNGRIEKVVLNSSDTTRYIYDNVGRKVKEISPKQYDPSLENLELKLYNGDHGYRYDYYTDGKVSAIKDPENNTTEYTYDACGNLKTETKPNGSIYQYEYDVMNRLARLYFKNSKDSTPILLEEYWYSILDDGSTQKICKKYINESEISTVTSISDYAGRLISQTNPDGTSTSTVYNKNGTVNFTTDAKGYSTYYKYDGLNRLTEQWTPFEKVNDTVKYTYQKIVYDRAGKKLQETIGKTSVAKDLVPTDYIAKNYEYYANGQIKILTQSDETGTIFGKTKYEYDADGNISKETVYTDADNTNITEYNYNYMGKVSEKKVHVKAGDIEGNDFASAQDTILSTSYTYDKNGNLKTITTPDEVTTTYIYDNMNRQTSVSQPGIDEYLMSATISSSTEYDWQGNTVRTTDANGNDTRYLYNKRGLLEKTTTEAKDALGNIVKTNTSTFYYDKAGRLTAEVAAKDYDPAKTLDQMNRVEYTYDLMGRVKTKTYVGEEKRVDPTNNFGWTTQQVRIVQKAYQYDANGNVIKELDALGFEAATDKASIDTQINTGYGIEYTYNLANKQDTVLYAETKAKGFTYTIKYSYDALGRTITELNSRGAITKYNYDGAGNVVSVAVNKLEDTSDQIIKTSTYDFTGKLLTETNMQSATKGSTTEYEYNALGQVRKAVYPSDASIPENTVKYQYDVMGRLKTQRDTKGAVDAYTYNNQGDVLSHTQKKQDNTEEITTLTRYDENGNARFVFDGNEKCTTYTYNEQNKVITSRQSASGIAHETTYTYDANGNQIAVTDWRGNTTTYVYDSLNRLIETIDAKQNSIQKLEYNHNNVQEKSYDALNKATVYTYDRNNRLLTTKDPENHTIGQTYNSICNLATKTDGRGNITTYYYDEFNRLETVVNAKNETTDYTYDLSGNLLTQKDGKGNITTYEYNVANKAIKRVDQGGRTESEGNYTYIPAKTETYTYNADGSLASKKDREGNTTVYVYDIHGRLQSQSIQIQNTTGSAISFTYDDNGNQLTMTDSTGTTIRTYDELGRVLTKTVPNIGTTYFQYDIISGMDEGCYAEITTDPKGNVTQKIFDKVGRLITVTAGGTTTTYSYYNNGARESVTYNDGTKDTAIEEYTYYGDGLLWTLTNTKLDAAGNTIIDSYSYTYDAAHNQTSKTDAKGVTSYTYDVLNRLETVTEPSGTLEAPSTTTTAYTYDAAGNRETETITKGTQITVNTYIYNEQNRLTRVETKVDGTLVTTTLYEYDDNGNQLKTTVNETITVVNEYDCWNQLITTMTNTGTTINAYNGEGYRVSKTVNGTLTRYLYEGDKVVLELDSSGYETARNVYGSNLIMREAIRTDGSNIFDTYFYLYNGHADVTALLKPDGTIAATYYYDAFGNITATGSANNNITFAGYQYDAETGLYYLNARMYDPRTARFLQEDTYLGDRNDPLSLNLYTYCHNEPLMYTDPTGHSWVSDRWDDVKKLGGKVGTAVSDGASYFVDKASDVWDATTGWVADKATDAVEWTNDNVIKPAVNIAKDISNAYSSYKSMSPQEKKITRAASRKALGVTNPGAAALDGIMSSWDETNQKLDAYQKFNNSIGFYNGDPIKTNVGMGIYQSLSGTVTGTYNLATNPFEVYDALKFLTTMLNPSMTQDKLMYQTSIGFDVYNKYNEFKNADGYTKLYMGTKATTDVAQVVAPFGPKWIKGVRGLEAEKAVSLSEFGLPKGATFEGKIYRSVKEGYNPLEMNSYTINSNHRYTQPGTEGLYFSTGEKIVNAELGSYNITSMAGRKMYPYETMLTNMLDLSNSNVRSRMGVKLEDLLSDNYRINIGNATTHQMGEFAKVNGFNGIIAPSARADGGLNIILFDATKIR